MDTEVQNCDAVDDRLASGLMGYLQGPGKANEHDTPHVVPGDAFLMSWFGTEELDRTGADEISAYLERPRELSGTAVRKQVKALDAETGRATVAGYTVAHVCIAR